MKRLTLGFLFLTLAFSSWPEDFSGKVVAVIDGDTLDVLHNGKAERVRLDGIDAPELGQAFGKQAKETLSKTIFGQEVNVKDKGKDKYGRTLGVIVNQQGWNINLTLVRSGYAWHYKEFSKDVKLAECEELARKQKVNLWSEAYPIPPWTYRDLENKIVYLTSYGKTYHNLGCKFLTSTNKDARLNSLSKDYTPCSSCNPPSLNDSQTTITQIVNVPSLSPAAQLERQRQLQLYQQQQYLVEQQRQSAIARSQQVSPPVGGSKTVNVRSYTRKDGTVVRAHKRSAPR